MKRMLRSLLMSVVALSCLTSVGVAAEGKIAVKVALLDMSAVMGMGMMGMGQGMGMGTAMMGQGMMTIRTDQGSVKTGAVSFDVTSWSRSLIHEMLVVAVESPTAPLPYSYNDAKVVEDQIKVLGDVADLAPNASKTFEVTLAPGSYLLVCNVPGHYAAGMVAALTVVP